jgi:hypothetical protein
MFERWKGRKKRYLYPGDGRKYWAMTSRVWHSRVINRMRIEDDLERLRREGQLQAVGHTERHLPIARRGRTIPTRLASIPAAPP